MTENCDHNRLIIVLSSPAVGHIETYDSTMARRRSALSWSAKADCRSGTPFSGTFPGPLSCRLLR